MAKRLLKLMRLEYLMGDLQHDKSVAVFGEPG